MGKKKERIAVLEAKLEELDACWSLINDVWKRLGASRPLRTGIEDDDVRDLWLTEFDAALSRRIDEERSLDGLAVAHDRRERSLALRPSGGESGEPMVDIPAEPDLVVNSERFLQQEATLAHLTASRMLIGRVAECLRISKWDEEGSEILEALNRWVSLKHFVRAELNRLRTIERDSPAVHVFTQALQSILTRMVSSKEMAAFLEHKPKSAITGAVVEVAEQDPLDGMDQLRVMPVDIVRLARLMTGDPERESDAPLHAYWDPIWETMARSVSASREFANLMNLIVLPILVRQGWVDKSPSREATPATTVARHPESRDTLEGGITGQLLEWEMVALRQLADWFQQNPTVLNSQGVYVLKKLATCSYVATYGDPARAAGTASDPSKR